MLIPDSQSDAGLREELKLYEFPSGMIKVILIDFRVQPGLNREQTRQDTHSLALNSPNNDLHSSHMGQILHYRFCISQVKDPLMHW